MNEIIEQNTTITTWLILGTVLVWIGWDVYLFLNDKTTISDKITKFGKHVTGVIFLIGFLMGHWFW